MGAEVYSDLNRLFNCPESPPPLTGEGLACPPSRASQARRAGKIQNLKSSILFPQQVDISYVHLMHALTLGSAFAAQGMCPRGGG